MARGGRVVAAGRRGLDAAGLRAVADGVSFTEAHRCGPAFRLTEPPAGLRYVGCRMELADGRVSRAETTLEVGGEQVVVTILAPETASWGPPATRLTEHPGGRVLVESETKGVKVSVEGPPVAREVAAAVDPAGLDPALWPHE